MELRIQETSRLFTVLNETRAAAWLCAVVCFAVLSAVSLPVAAEMSDSQFEAALRERNRDFDKYVQARKRDSKYESEAAEALKLARERRSKEQALLEVAYQKSMKRYSMEEVEALDRADEERLAQLANVSDERNSNFVKNRDRQREIEAAVGPIDSYLEFEIDMTQAPETKVSFTTGSGL